MDRDYLWQTAGALIQQGLQDICVTDISRNADGAVWFMHQQEGHQLIGNMHEADVNRWVHALAHYHDVFLNASSPYLDATLPFQGERIHVAIPPVCEAVTLSIRKHQPRVLSLDDYVMAGRMSALQCEVLQQAIRDERRILISGSPGSGKTTLANALLQCMAQLMSVGYRVLILEDTPELQCSLQNSVRLQTHGALNMTTLLWLAMRSSPQCICVGEVRDGSALDLLKAWNTGCRGGVATLHANSARAALYRLADLAAEVIATPPFTLIAEAIDLVVQLERDTLSGHYVVSDIIEVMGFDRTRQDFLTCSLM